jgi:hypothetical protein
MMEFKAVISVLYYVVSTRSAAPRTLHQKPVITINIIFYDVYTPPILVKAAYNKSVPTAVVGGIPNHNRIGVIKEPPTPVPDETYNQTAMTNLFENP